MKTYKVLNIKGAVIDNIGLQKYLEKLASDHILKEKSEKDTYPIPRMMENFDVITEVYRLLNEHIKLKIPIHPAGEWLLDNYYVIEETVKNIEKEMTLKKYTRFLGLANSINYGFARIYVLATEIVSYTDAKVTSDTLIELLRSYQEKKKLSMEEIWNIGMFLQIALIENIRTICEKIYSVQVQKYKVENIIERLVENKEKDKLKFNKLNEYKSKVKEYGEMKYPFIEYMSFKLRQYGKIGYPFFNILEEEVNKMGTDVSEVIKKEHFDIAVKKVSMGNSITSIKNIQRINFIEIFENINQVDEILKKDPANIYDKMDYKTKIYYRNEIEEISKKTKISEIYVARKCLELSENKEGKESHIGYYLIDKGKKELLESLLNKRINKISNKNKMTIFIGIKTFFSLIFSVLVSLYILNQTNNIFLFILSIIIMYIPIENIIVQLFQYILSKIIKPKLIPKLDFQNGVPSQYSTFVVIPTIIDKTEKLEKMFKKLEVYYLANKSDNIYFALLADVTSGDKQEEEIDKKIAEKGIKILKKLNQKYPDKDFPKFHFVYRKREWNDKEGCYLGWERKRGLLNQFNEYLLKNSKNEFRVNTIDINKMPAIKYIITLDADTELVLNSGLELIGGMAHILNKPKIENGIVKEGYGIIQPRVGIGLKEAGKTYFCKIYAGSPGTDSYTNAISDIYQDNFKEAIYTGKGIYDLQVFSDVLKNEIPENTVLSHDLLEGSYLKCGLATDIMLMDGYPKSHLSYKTRQLRWTRGDWQIIRWLKRKINVKDGKEKDNPLNVISKYKILNNLVKSILEIFILLGIIYFSAIKLIYNVNIWPFILVLIASTIIPSLIEILNKIIYKKDGEKIQKTFYKNISGIKGSIIRGILSIGLLPDKAYYMFATIIKTIYRMNISKQHLLEWTTSEEAEQSSKTDILSYYRNMWFNPFLGIIFILLTKVNVIYGILGILWIITPIVMMYLSKETKAKENIEILSKADKEYVLEIGKRTWSFFKEHISEKSNYLPPDNYQEDRKEKVVYRTSPTNIGLGILSVISSYDLGYENLEDTINLLNKMFETILKLEKWNGHLYNWYNIETLTPLVPRYVSTVDSGNFIGYLYTAKQFLKKIENEETLNYLKVNNLIEIIDKIIKETNFKVLYSEKNRIFSIGFNIEENSLTPSYYDLLASEARQASLIAISKKDVPAKHWYNLSRTLTIINKYKGLISWSGTAFEYLMPNINIPKYPGSIISESSIFSIMAQQEYAKKLKLPWGISESAFNLKDLNNNYQYKAFGIPWLGLKRGLADEFVIAPYASILAINDFPKETINNLHVLEEEGMYNKYGFYESIDYTLTRLNKNEKKAVVKTYMAHHQGLILVSINNLFNNNIMQKRFMENPEIQSVEILLEEKMPENVIITKNEKEKVERIKNIDYETYRVREINKPYEKIKSINAISNENYLILIDSKGNGYSKYKDIVINRFKVTDELEQGIHFYIKNIKSKRIWSSGQMNFLSMADKYNVQFTPDMDKFVRHDGAIETKTKIFVMPNVPVEVRRIEISNSGNSEETFEITSVIEPILSTLDADYSHKAFNSLFLRFEFLEENNTLLVKRKARDKNSKDIYMAINLYTENNCIGELEFELDKEKFLGRQNIELPIGVKESIPFGRKTIMTPDPIIAMRRTINIPQGEKIVLNLIISVSEDREEAINNLKDNLNNTIIERGMNLSKAKVEAETMYVGLKAKDIERYQKILGYLIFNNPLKTLMFKNKIPDEAPVTELWKYGISGDLSILLVKIKDITDINVVKDLLKAYEYFRIKNINIDLVILNEEKKSYDNYLNDEIQNAILNLNLGYLQNIKGGIFILNNIPKEQRRILEYRAKLLINAHLGNVGTQLKDFEEEYIDGIKEVETKNEKIQLIEEENNIKPKINMNNLKYYNEYGGFSEDGSEYIIKVNKNERLPTVWSNIMANEKIGTVVTEGMGGYTWYKNSRLNRLTAWNNDQVIDVPSEIIYLEDLDNNKVWSLAVNPAPDDNDYYIIYGFGYSKYYHISNGIEQSATVFIPEKDSAKINLIKLSNKLAKKKKIRLIYYIKPVLGEDEIKSNEYMFLKFNENMNLITVESRLTKKEERTIMYVTCSEKINSYTGNKQNFLGNKTLKNPNGLKKVELNGENSINKDNILAIEINIELEAFEEKEISLIMGAEENILNLQDTAYKYSNVNNSINEYENVKKNWKELLGKIKVETPLESMNILLNGWLLYQTYSSRMLARSGYYQSGGAFGFRDQLQDCISLKYISPNILKNQIIKHSKHQFIEGDVEHWWHDETSRGIRTRFSDDLLWLPYMLEEYLSFTKDTSILYEETNYLKGDILEKGVDEKYDLYKEGNIKESIYKHCIKAIEKSLDFGKNGLPKIGSGDWNDGFSTVGNKGIGESVWLGFFLYKILTRFIDICKIMGNIELAEKYKRISDELKKNLNDKAWDGRWYKRAFMDDGNELGSIKNEECKIDSIAQSWSIISGAGDNDKKYISLNSLENHLVDKEIGIIKLLDPPFEKSNLEPGYIKAYIPGTRENGGQYTHGSVWAIIAEAMLGFGDKAVEYFRMINPIEHARTKEEAKKYKVEPYVIAADVYGGSLAGRGGWTWYSGSSSWMYETGIRYILGLNIKGNILKLEPCIASNWNEYKIRYKYENSIYNIKVINKNGKNIGISKIYLNGIKLENNEIILDGTGKIFNVEAEI